MSFLRFVYGLSTVCPRCVYGLFRPLSTPDQKSNSRRVQINVLNTSLPGWKHVNLTVEEEQGVYIYILYPYVRHLCRDPTTHRSPRMM